MKKYFMPFAVLVMWLLAGSLTATAKDKSLDNILDIMQQAYDGTKAYSADFEQRTASANARKPKIARGKVMFAKPGKMRWDYTLPPKAFVTDGKTFWMVQPERREVLEMPAKKAFGNRTPMSFLSGMGDLRKEFEASLQKQEGNIATLKLKLKKPTNQAQYLIMKINTNTGMAQSVKTVDFFGAYNTIIFSHYKLDEKFKPGTFVYKPRKGYRTVRPQKALPGAYRKSGK